MFEKHQQLKIANDKIYQLTEKNTYRREVVRLERVLEENEKERSLLIENAGKQNEQLKMTESNLSNFMTENSVLKNKIKQQKMLIDDIEVQKCAQCEEDEKLINELLVMLDSIKKDIDEKETEEADSDTVFRSYLKDLNGSLEMIEKAVLPEKDLFKGIQTVPAGNEGGEISAASHLTYPSGQGVECSSNMNSPTKPSTIHPSGLAYIPAKDDCLLHHANRFAPLQYVNNNSILPPHDSSPSIPLRPGPHLYSETVKMQKLPCTMILTDSMAGGIKMNNIKRNVGVKDRGVVIKRFPGHTAEEIAYYAPKPLGDKKPDQVIVIAGTNDLTRHMYDKGDVDEYVVADSILKIGRAAREQGAKKIYISGIMIRRGFKYGEIVNRVNNLLYMACVVEDFAFINQDDIKVAHISSDGTHLNSYGTAILMFNVFSVFNTFDYNFSDFKEDYDYAMVLG